MTNILYSIFGVKIEKKIGVYIIYIWSSDKSSHTLRGMRGVYVSFMYTTLF